MNACPGRIQAVVRDLVDARAQLGRGRIARRRDAQHVGQGAACFGQPVFAHEHGHALVAQCIHARATLRRDARPRVLHRRHGRAHAIGELQPFLRAVEIVLRGAFLGAADQGAFDRGDALRCARIAGTTFQRFAEIIQRAAIAGRFAQAPRLQFAFAAMIELHRLIGAIHARKIIAHRRIVRRGGAPHFADFMRAHQAIRIRIHAAERGIARHDQHFDRTRVGASDVGVVGHARVEFEQQRHGVARATEEAAFVERLLRFGEHRGLFADRDHHRRRLPRGNDDRFLAGDRHQRVAFGIGGGGLVRALAIAGGEREDARKGKQAGRAGPWRRHERPWGRDATMVGHGRYPGNRGVRAP